MKSKKEQDMEFWTKPIIRTLSAIEYMNKHQIDWYILSTDIFKAYDRTHMGYKMNVMLRMGYTKRGVDVLIALLKQGDPLIVPLFIINMEPLVRQIHHVVTGVPVQPCLQKTEAFMDNVNVTSTYREDIAKIDAVFMDYESLSCMHLSRSRKTMGRRTAVGAWLGPACGPTYTTGGAVVANYGGN